MYRSIPLAFLAAALLSAAPVAVDRVGTPAFSLATADAATSVDINVFFTSLSPYGAWIPSSDYNYVWVPTQVDASWSPYTDGHWIYTEEYGWYFASDEPFASIVYHYGRWGYDPLIGWYWVPGTNWAPAWVAWRQDNDDIGWAPLPPQGNGYATDVNITINIGEVPDHYWRFVQSNDFLAPRLNTVAFDSNRHPEVLHATQPSGFVSVKNNIVINNVINLNFVEQQTKQTVTPTKINTVSDPKQASGSAGDNGGKPGGSVNAFIASLAPPDKTVKPGKIDSLTSFQAPTKGQSTLPSNPQEKIGSLGPNGGNPAGGNGPTGNGGNGPNGSGPNGQPSGTATATPNGGQPGPGAGNPRCSDPTFAKNNPKTCTTSGNTTATVNPNAGVTTNGGTSTTNGSVTTNGGASATGGNGNGGKGPGNPAATGATPSTNGSTATTTTNGNGKGPGGGTPNGGGTSAGANANANANGGAAATCADPTFAKNNPKTCGGQGNTGAGGQQGNNTTGRSGANGGPTGNQTNNVGGSGPKSGVTGAGGSNPADTAVGSITPSGNGNGAGNTCSNPAYAKANPKTCGGQDGGSATATATGGATGGAAAGGAGGGKGNISVQGNAATACADPTFAKDNPKECAPVTGTATTGRGNGR
jgi:hypothetical protein